MPATYVNAETPSRAVDLLAQRYGEAVEALRGALDRFLNDGVAPTPEIRALFRYPRLRVTYRPDGATPANPRAFAKFSVAGVYSTTVTHPEEFRAYLLEQLGPLASEYGAQMEVGLGGQEIAYPYVVRDRRRTRSRRRDRIRTRAPFSRALAHGGRRRDRRRRIRNPPRRGTAAGAVRRGARRLFAAAAGALHGFGLARDAALGAADQLSSLRRSVRALGPRAIARGRGRREAGAARRRDDRGPPQPGRGGCAARRPRLASLPNAGLPCRARGRARASASSTSASVPPTPRTSPTISRCCGRIAG